MKIFKHPYFAQITILTVIFYLLYKLLLFVYSEWNVPNFEVFIFLFLYIVNLLGFLLTKFVIENGKEFIVHIIFGSVVIRLILFTAIIFAIIYLSKPNALPNVILFFAFYFVLTVLDICALLKLLSTRGNTLPNPEK